MLDIQALFKLSYGIFILGARKAEGGYAGCLVNTVFQLTAEPVRVGVSVSKNNQTHGAICQSGTVGVSIMGEQAPAALLGRFGYRSGRDFDKFAGLDFKTDCHGDPLMTEGAVSHLSCRVEQQLDMGTHTLFVCAVEDGAICSEDIPMTYKYYRDVIKLKSSANAPTFVKG